MKKLSHVLLALACFCALPAVPPAHAQAEVIPAAMAVDQVISNVRNALSEAISQAEVAGTVVSFRVASDAKILLQNLDIMAKELSGKVFSDLNTSQQAALNNLLLVSKETTRDLGRNIAQLDNAVRNAGQEISRIPGVSDRPFVSTYSPNYLLRQDRAFDVVVRGSLLNGVSQSLTIGGTACTQVTSVENELRFSCPASALNSNSWVPGRLDLTRKAKWYQVFKPDPVYTYTLALMSIPSQMGTYTLDVTGKRTVDVFNARSAGDGYRNGHCSGGRDVAWTYVPAQGCTIDLPSVRVTHSATTNSSYGGVANLTPAGFQVRGVVRNSGRCVWPSKDARGSLNVSASWRDRCPKVEEYSIPSQGGTLHWGSEVAIPLPADVSKYVLRVKLANGQERVINEVGSTSTDWFIAAVDPNTKVLVIRPRQLEDALH